MWVLLLTVFFFKLKWKYENEPSFLHVAWLLVCLRKGQLSWFWVLNAVHVFDQVFEAQWDLAAYILHVDCTFLVMGFTCICVWAYVSREIGATLALFIMEKIKRDWWGSYNQIIVVPVCTSSPSINGSWEPCFEPLADECPSLQFFWMISHLWKNTLHNYTWFYHLPSVHECIFPGILIYL